MIDKEDIKKIKEIVGEFLEKMTLSASNIDANFSVIEPSEAKPVTDVVNVSIKLDEPQILIGERGQTLFETQRIMRSVLNKKIQKIFYLNLDINDYKKKKIEYLKDLARELADQVALNKEEKELFPMPAYERRVIHAELSQRTDVVTESRGDGQDRYIIIKPR